MVPLICILLWLTGISATQHGCLLADDKHSTQLTYAITECNNVTMSCSSGCPLRSWWDGLPPCSDDCSGALMTRVVADWDSRDFSCVNISVYLDTAVFRNVHSIALQLSMDESNCASLCRVMHLPIDHERLVHLHLPMICLNSHCDGKNVKLSVAPYIENSQLLSAVFLWPRYLNKHKGDCGPYPLPVVDFSRARSLQYKVSFPKADNFIYEVELRKNNQPSNVTRIPGEQTCAAAKFEVNSPGNYVYYVRTYSDIESRPCATGDSPVFKIDQIALPPSPGEKASLIVAFVVTIICLMFAVTAAVFMHQIWKIVQKIKHHRPRCLILYSYDTELHERVVRELAGYIKVSCHCDVRLDVWDLRNKSPVLWVQKEVDEADCIVIVWSKGTQLKLNPKATSVLRNEREHFGGDLFNLMWYQVCCRLQRDLSLPISARRIQSRCLVTLPYTVRVPPVFTISDLPTFHLPDNTGSLLAHLHHVPVVFSVAFQHLQRFQQWRHSVFPAENVKVLLLDAISEMNCFESSRPDWFNELLVEIPDQPELRCCSRESSSCCPDQPEAEDRAEENEGSGGEEERLNASSDGPGLIRTNSLLDMLNVFGRTSPVVRYNHQPASQERDNFILNLIRNGPEFGFPSEDSHAPSMMSELTRDGDSHGRRLPIQILYGRDNTTLCSTQSSATADI